MKTTVTDAIDTDITVWRSTRKAVENDDQAASRKEPPIGRAMGIERSDLLAGVLLIVIGFLLWWLSAAHASTMPFWAPWDFSWVEFISTWLVIWWFVRGLARTAAPRRPSLARWIGFLAGTLAIYSVLETHFEYAAQHMLVLNRIQMW